MLKLNVFHRDTFIGEIRCDAEADSFDFEYAEAWLARKGFLLSPHIRPEGNSRYAVRRFLENLLPEDKRLPDLTEITRISRSNIFGLTLAIGQETTGALTILGGDQTPDSIPTTFQAISAAQLRERILGREFQPIGHWAGKPRLSIAGVQDKLPLCITPDGHFGFGEGRLASTHILKFGNKRDLHLVVNEWLCMELARRCKLPVAEVEILRVGEPVLKVTRFDRTWQGDEVIRHHVIDGCQFTNRPSGWKYERQHGHGRDVALYEDGGSFERLGQQRRDLASPAKDLALIADWVLFNLLCENADAHGKNISFAARGQRFAVSPFYDLLNIRVYGDHYEDRLAMSVGGEYDLALVGVYQLHEFASALGLPARAVAMRLAKLCQTGLLVAQAIGADLGQLTADERDFAELLLSRFMQQCRRFLEFGQELKMARF